MSRRVFATRLCEHLWAHSYTSASPLPTPYLSMSLPAPPQPPLPIRQWLEASITRSPCDMDVKLSGMSGFWGVTSHEPKHADSGLLWLLLAWRLCGHGGVMATGTESDRMVGLGVWKDGQPRQSWANTPVSISKCGPSDFRTDGPIQHQTVCYVHL